MMAIAMMTGTMPIPIRWRVFADALGSSDFRTSSDTPCMFCGYVDPDHASWCGVSPSPGFIAEGDPSYRHTPADFQEPR